MRTPVSALLEHPGEECTIMGFVANTRVLKRMVFLVIQDRTGSVQVSIDRQSLSTELVETAMAVTLGSAVRITGVVDVNPSVRAGGVELRARSIVVEGAAEPKLPIAEDSSLELQQQWRFLALRSEKNHLLFEVQTTVEAAMRGFLVDRGFVEIHTPKLMHSASESGAETFSLEYFELGKAYLAQSPQFYKQMAMAAGLERVFEFGPVFRAEPSMTPRHAAEFTSVDIEMSWVDSHEDVMAMEEAWLRHILAVVRERHGETITRLFGAEIVVPTTPFPRIRMQDAHAFLAGAGHVIAPATKPGDLDSEGERLLARHVLETQGSEFYFLTDYPLSLRPFYHMREGGVTRSFDLMWKGTEITTGAQREHRHEPLAAQAREMGLESAVGYYLDFFRFGCPPHGGFGFGLARMLMLMLNLPSIREAVFLHRSPTRLAP